MKNALHALWNDDKFWCKASVVLILTLLVLLIAGSLLIHWQSASMDRALMIIDYLQQQVVLDKIE